jgi:hypothetical protein
MEQALQEYTQQDLETRSSQPIYGIIIDITKFVTVNMGQRRPKNQNATSSSKNQRAPKSNQVHAKRFTK